MSKILISWLATSNDFLGNEEINPTGPNINMHEFHWTFDKHLLLHTPDFKKQAEKLKIFLIQKYNHEVELVCFDIDNKVHEDLAVIKNKSESLLLDFKDENLFILISTGSGIMKIAWYICHSTLSLNTTLLQILPPITKNKQIFTELIEIKTELSQIPFSAIIRQNSFSEKVDDKLFVTESLQRTYSNALKLAQTDNVSVLILGNTGTGKEILANYIHSNSPRKHKPFMAFNCSAFTDTLLESILFGHKKGSFTGAFDDKKGILEQANGGTVFLDEIGDISPYMQQSLLRFMQSKEIQPIGGKAKKVDVRIIAATNKNIPEMTKNGSFRSDLFYRLGLVLKLSDFNSYKEAEKLKWFDYLSNLKKNEFKRSKTLKFDEDLKIFLLNYSFPGNIRELINIIENLYVFSDGIAHLTDIPFYINNESYNNSMSLKELEIQHINKVLKICEGNKSKAAKMLGISLNTLKSKI